MPSKIRIRPEPPQFIIRHLTNVPLTFLDSAGKQVKENFSIEFRSFTAYGFSKLNAALENMTFIGDVGLQCEIMARSIIKISDNEGQALTDETGEPAELTANFFLGLLDEDRDAIKAAMKEDSNPQPASAAPGTFGSKQMASEA